MGLADTAGPSERPHPQGQHASDGHLRVLQQLFCLDVCALDSLLHALSKKQVGVLLHVQHCCCMHCSMHRRTTLPHAPSKRQVGVPLHVPHRCMQMSKKAGGCASACPALPYAPSKSRLVYLKTEC
eukprot:1137846-Pelagomonas_calceolata.AAC.3